MVKIHQDSWKTFPSGSRINLIEVKLKDKFNFECQRCGKCCYRPPAVNPAEAYRIAQHRGESAAEFAGDYIDFVKEPGYGWRAIIKKQEDGRCTFYNGNKCEVFPVAPRQCKARPLSGGKDGGGENVRLKSMNILLNICGGIGKGKEHTVKEWIREKDLQQMWQEELDHRWEVEMWMCYPDSLSRVIDMFSNYKKK
jgi:Fe-S-cluster containining protein